MNTNSGMNNDDKPLPLNLNLTPDKKIVVSDEELKQLKTIYNQSGNIMYRSEPESTITMGIKETMAAVYEANKAKGFWDEKRNVGEMLMLITSELAEALEADRKGDNCANRTCGVPTQAILEYSNGLEVSNEDFNEGFKSDIKDTFEDEIADAVIRLFDISAGLGIDLEFHIKAKMKYNSLRPHKHGKRY